MFWLHVALSTGEIPLLSPPVATVWGSALPELQVLWRGVEVRLTPHTPVLAVTWGFTCLRCLPTRCHVWVWFNSCSGAPALPVSGPQRVLHNSLHSSR